MQNADDLVDIVAVHGQSGVFTFLDDAFDVTDVIVQIDANDLIVRHHYVIDRDLLEIENADQHPTVSIRNSATGLVHDGAQLFLRQRMRSRVAATHTKQVQDTIGGDICQPDNRVRDLE